MRLGDLDALKKKLNSRVFQGDYTTTLLLSSFNDLIDNAPTVDIKDQIAGAYNEGYMCGSKEAEKARPQGEWIKVKEERMSVDMSGEIVTRYKCSKCGRVIATFPNKLAEYYPFCHCGAKMKGGAE